MNKYCDNCKYYRWYYDRCTKWDCEIDSRSVQDCHEPKLKKVVKSWCVYEHVKHKEPPCTAKCHADCEYMLLMYEDGYSILGNETPNEGYEKPKGVTL